MSFVTFTCSNPTCTASHGISRAEFVTFGTTRPLTRAGWSFERQPFDTTRWWYCPTHRTESAAA